jgi:hypothetical protein
MNKINARKLVISISGIIVLLMISPSKTAYLAKSLALGLVLVILIFSNRRISRRCEIDIKAIYWNCALVISALLGCNFYGTWTWGRHDKISEICSRIGVSIEVFWTFFAAIGAICAMPICAFVISYVLETFCKILSDTGDGKHDFKANTYSMIKSIMILFAVYVLGISSIIRANFNYIDDNARVSQGYKGWGGFSRILSNIIASFIHMDNYLTDVSPLPQLMAALIMAVSGILMLVIVYGRKRFTLLEILALSTLCLNPYFLECISYKYDAPYMALSVFGAIFPLLYRYRSRFSYVCMSVIGSLIVCTTYQAASGIYPMLVVLLMVGMWMKRDSVKEISAFCVSSVAGYGIGILIFRFVIMIEQSGGYASSNLPKVGEIVPTIIYNLYQYYNNVLKDFKSWWILLVVIQGICFVWIMARLSEQKRLQTYIISIATVLIMGILCFGMYPVLSKPIFYPRAMYGFGIFLTLMSVCIVNSDTYKGRFIYLSFPTFALAWAFFVFSFTYGNALSLQKEYTEFRIEQILDDFNDMDLFMSGNVVTVQIEGDIGYSPVIKAMPQNYQILNRLVPKTLSGDVEWEMCLRKFYNFYDMNNFVLNQYIDLKTYDLPLLEEHTYHNIYGDGEYVLVELK